LVILLKVAITFGFYQGAVQRLFLLVPWIWIGVTGLQLYFLTKKTEMNEKCLMGDDKK
jgi:hypothetical protein